MLILENFLIPNLFKASNKNILKPYPRTSDSDKRQRISKFLEEQNLMTL